jgi:hypothetical protein
MLTGRRDPPLAQTNQLRSSCKKSIQDGINTTEVALGDKGNNRGEKGIHHSGEDDNEAFHNKL